MTVVKTLTERGSRYGQFADHARIAQGIQDVMRAASKWSQLDQDMKQALTVIADKIARILNGDPFYLDNWHDIQGYAKLIEDRLNMIDRESDQALFAPDTRSMNDVIEDMRARRVPHIHEQTTYSAENPLREQNPWTTKDGIPISHGFAKRRESSSTPV